MVRIFAIARGCYFQIRPVLTFPFDFNIAAGSHFDRNERGVLLRRVLYLYVSPFEMALTLGKESWV